MITFETKIKDKTVKMFADLPLKNAAAAVFRVLMQVSEKTNIFDEKFVLGFGWGYFYMAKKKDEKGKTFWEVQAPDFEKNALTDRSDNVTASLIIQNMQMEAVQVADVDPENTTMRDTMLVLKAAMQAKDVYMCRNEKGENGDSGWYFGLLDDPDEENHTPDEYLTLNTFQLMKFRGDALRVLQLPVGTVAVFHENQLTALVDGDDKPMKFTTDEERRKLGEKQRAEFEAQVAEAKRQAQAESGNKKNPDIPAGAIVEDINGKK